MENKKSKNNFTSWIFVIIGLIINFLMHKIFSQSISMELIAYIIGGLIIPVGFSLCIGYVAFRLRKNKENSFFIYFATTFFIICITVFLSEYYLSTR